MRQTKIIKKSLNSKKFDSVKLILQGVFKKYFNFNLKFASLTHIKTQAAVHLNLFLIRLIQKVFSTQKRVDESKIIPPVLIFKYGTRIPFTLLVTQLEKKL